MTDSLYIQGGRVDMGVQRSLSVADSLYSQGGGMGSPQPARSARSAADLHPGPQACDEAGSEPGGTGAQMDNQVRCGIKHTFI